MPANTVTGYLEQLPGERRQALSIVRDVILANLPEGYTEGVQFGMIAYTVPLSRYAQTYNGAPLLYAALASQKNYMSLYLTSVYADPEAAEQFAEAYRNTGKRLDMGKSCVRFRKLDDLPLDLVGHTVAGTSVDAFVAAYGEERRRKRGEELTGAERVPRR